MAQYSLAISIESLGYKCPQFGRTQYFFGAVVLILNKMVLSVGLVNRIYDVIDELNGPKKLKKKYVFY